MYIHTYTVGQKSIWHAPILQFSHLKKSMKSHMIYKEFVYIMVHKISI